MAYKGKYKVRAPYKYKGNPTKVIYRSLWELKFMTYCDTNINILEWGSEEVYMWYRSPVDNRAHRYFPDFYIKVREKNGTIKNILLKLNHKDKPNHLLDLNVKQKVTYVKRLNMQRTKQSGKQQTNGVLIGDLNSK